MEELAAMGIEDNSSKIENFQPLVERRRYLRCIIISALKRHGLQ
jgi:hypothetical protein